MERDMKKFIQRYKNKRKLSKLFERSLQLQNFSVIELQERAKHLEWMLDEIPKIEDAEKRARWIGFVQGHFWTLGVFTIDQMRAHVRELIAAS
jgi:hypothetical protein